MKVCQLTSPAIYRWAACLCLGAALFALPSVAVAQSVAEQAPSAKFVPEDAGMYSVFLKNKEQFDIVAESNAWARVTEMQSVGPLLEQAAAMIEMAKADPGTAGIMNAVLDGLSHEVFMYTDEEYGEFARIMNEASGQGDMANLIAQLGGGFADGTEQARGMFDALHANVDKLKVPVLVIGMRMSDPDQGKLLVAWAEEMAAVPLAGTPLAEELKREAVGGSEFVTLPLEGAMVPWDEIPWDEIADEPGKYDSVIEKLRGMKITISLGMMDDYLLISMGPSNEHLAKFGGGTGITGKPEFAKLQEFDGTKVATIGYVSKEVNQAATQAQLGQLVGMLAGLRSAIPEDVDPMVRRQLEDDIQKFSDAVNEAPEVGAAVSAAKLTKRGYEMKMWNWTENSALDGSKPLSILNHVGGNPLMFTVARGKTEEGDYDALVDLLGSLDETISAMMEATVAEEDFEEYSAFRKAIGPHLERIDKANRDMLLPAMKDGQGGLVIDAQIKSKQWFNAMPPSEKALPMLEMALVFGIDDAELVKKGAAEYLAATNGIFAELHKIAPDEVPDITIPDPKHRRFGDADIYYFLIPKDAGVDKRIAPNGGVTETMAAVSFAPLTTKRVLEKTPPASGLLTQYADKPIASATSVNFAGMVDAAMPWAEFGYNMFMGAGGISDPLTVQDFGDDDFGDDDFGDDDFGGPAVDYWEEIQTGADVLKCIRGWQSATFVEDGVTVTHGELHIQDLP